ncbi:MAG TPA: DUF3617 family protein [Allosphingosinicella sp.]|nr:DUF3617 family protein [Allosphingosinicella sp.]
MRYSSGIAAAAVLAACGGSLARAGGDSGGGGQSAVSLQPGEWEMTTTIIRMSVPEPTTNLPVPPPHTARVCVTPEQAASPARDLTESLDGCTGQNHWGPDGRIEVSLLCETPQGAVQLRIDGHHRATAVDLNQQVSTRWEGSTLVMDARITGRRIGECTARRPASR